MNIEEYLSFENDLIIEKFGKKRRPFIILFSDSLPILCQEYEKFFGKSAKGILNICFYELGKSTAQSMISNYEYKNLEDFFENLKNIGINFRWYEDLTFKRDEKCFLIETKNNFFVKNDLKGCEYLSKWFAGMISICLLKEFDGIEESCQIDNKKSCRFKIFQR